MAQSSYWTSHSENHRTSRRRFLAGSSVVAAGAASLAVVGCGDDSTSSSASPTAAGGASPVAAVPKYGGILNVIAGNDYAFDSIIDSTSAANTLSSYLYSRLIKFQGDADFDKAAGVNLVPDLAITLPEQPDKLTYTFKLNPAAKFHNKAPVNGRALIADDVLQSYRRVTSESKNTNKDTLLSSMDGEPKVLDEHTVQFKTKLPYAPFLPGVLASPQYLWVYPKEILSNDALRTSNPVGSGPWMFKSRQQSVSWEFDRNPDYYLKDSAGRQIPYLDGVKVNVIPDAANQLAQFVGGNISYANITYQDLDTVKSQVKGAQVIPARGGYFYFSPQQRKERGGPWIDKRMRQALSLTIDRAGQLKLFWDGNGKYYGLTSPSLGSWSVDMRDDKVGRKQWYQRDLKTAKELISAAGYNGEPLRYIYSNNAYGDQFNQMAVFWASNMKEAGLNAQVITQDYRSEFITAGKTFFGNYDGISWQPEAPHTDPYTLHYHMLYKDNSWNHAGINDPRADALVDKLAGEFDRAARQAICLQIDQLNADEMYYITPATGDSYTFVQPNVKNFGLTPHGYSYSSDVYPTIWIEPKA